MSGFDYDFFVIGAGSGGVRAARIAAQHGARVAIAEEFRFGGTCVIRGCVPKKLLVYASRFPNDFEDSAGFGWQLAKPHLDWRALVTAKEREITRLEGIYRATLLKAGVTLFPERGTVAGANSVRLEKSQRPVTAKYILIATGARPNTDAAILGHELAITSNEAFDLEKFPERIVILGGGYIAAEFASIFNGLGSRVTLIYRGDKILRGFDDDLRSAASAAMTARGIRILTGQSLKSIARDGSALKVETTAGERIAADQAMIAIGRRPNTSGLGLEQAGVTLTDSGAVKVDAADQSSIPSIFAAGDVTDRVHLTPVAIREGHALAERLFANKASAVDYTTIPTAVFTTPEIGTVGLSEQMARAGGRAIDIYKTSFRPMRNVLANRDERTLMKLVVDRETNVVLGVHIFGPDAAEIVQMAGIALRLKATKADFDATMALHPSAAEELVTLREKWLAPGAAAG